MAGDIREVVTGDNGEAHVPPGLDVTVPHPARVYNYLLGGKDNYAADRKAAESFLAGGAKIRVGVRSNRAFLGRAVRFLAQECGIRQFLDIGTGLPSADNTHEVAQAVAPESRIAYVDNDPIVLSHANALLRSTPSGVCQHIPGRYPGAGQDPQRGRADAGLQPAVAIMILMTLQYIPDSDNPHQIVKTLVDAVPSGELPGAVRCRAGPGGGRQREGIRRQPQPADARHPPEPAQS